MNSNLKYKLFALVFWVNSLLYGLVYFFPYTDYGEPQIPIMFKLALDLLLVSFIIISSPKKKLNEVELSLFLFLVLVCVIGFIHTFHTNIKDFLHYSVRNVVFYAIILFVNIFNDQNHYSFHKLHYKVFRFVLFFGVLLFLLKIIGVGNPFGSHYWLWEKNRLISSWLNPNSFGFYLLFYLIYVYFLNKKITPVFLITAFSIFLTGSLTAMAGLAMVILLLLIKLLLQNSIKPIYILLILISFPIALYLAIILGVFDYLFFKIDILFLNPSSTHTSVSTRVRNLVDLYNYFSWDNSLSIIFGDFSTTEYNRLDSQYLNIFYNYGVIGLLSFMLFQVLIIIKLYNGKTIYSKAMFVFSIWLFLIAYNLTAYLYRSNISIFYYIMLSFIFYIEKYNRKDYIYGT